MSEVTSCLSPISGHLASPSSHSQNDLGELALAGSLSSLCVSENNSKNTNEWRKYLDNIVLLTMQMPKLWWFNVEIFHKSIPNIHTSWKFGPSEWANLILQQPNCSSLQLTIVNGSGKWDLNNLIWYMITHFQINQTSNKILEFTCFTAESLSDCCLKGTSWNT